MLEGWGDFLVAAAGATSALAGLLFVALSVNLKELLQHPSIATRAAETLILLTGALLIVMVSLMPDLGGDRLRLPLMVIAATTWGIPTFLQLRSSRGPDSPKLRYVFQRAIAHQAAALPLLIGAWRVGSEGAAAFAWIAWGVMLCLAAALISAWVLLVEVLR